MLQIKTGSPKIQIGIYTRDKVYEINSYVGDPNSDVLAVTTTKSLGSASGTFTIDFVTKKDAEKKTWADKIEVFDYVEIKMQGIDDDHLKMVMRGLVDSIEFSESYEGGLPVRRITVSGRDLGVLFTDFCIWYPIELQPWAKIIGCLSWDPLPEIMMSPQDMFDWIIKKWLSTVDLKVGRYYGDQQISTGVASKYVKVFAAAISDKLKAHIFTYYDGKEGPFWNALDEWADKPWHELMIFDTDDSAILCLRPSRLKDMKGVYYHGTLSAMKAIPDAYQEDIHFSDVDKVSMTVRKSSNQIHNYIFTYPNVPENADDYRAMAVEDHANDPWNSMNPYMAILPPTDYSEVPSTNEPLSYTGRYGMRQLYLRTNFVPIDAGQPYKEKNLEPQREYETPEGLAISHAPNVGGNEKRKIGSIPTSLTKYDNYVTQASKAHGVDKNLVYAVMRKENPGGVPTAVGYNPATPTRPPSRDIGLMQLNDSNYAGWNFTEAQARDPQANVDKGTWYLSTLLKKYGNTAEGQQKAIAAYNCGPGNTDKAIAQGGTAWRNYLPETTKGYLKDVTKNYQDFKTSTGKMSDDELMEYTVVEKRMQRDEEADSKAWYQHAKDTYKDIGLELNKIVVGWYLHNHYLLEGSIAIRGTADARIGIYAIDDDDNMEYYVETVSHDFRIFEAYRTNLTVTRGMPSEGGLFSKGLRGPVYFGDIAVTKLSTGEKLTVMTSGVQTTIGQ